MYTTKSFCHVDTFVSNEPGTDSTLGEITPYLLTFSREIGKYANSSFPNLTLYSMYAKSGSGSEAVSQTMSTEQVNLCLEMCNYVVTQIAAANGGQIYQDVLQGELQAFGADLGLVNVIVGSVSHHVNRWGPDFISFKLSSDTSEEHTIWFSSTAMNSQYTEYEIVVVPPFEPLDQFFTTPGNVLNLLNAITQSQTMQRINAAANGKPYTEAVSSSFDYYNPINSSQTYNTEWVTLHYGPAGVNIDSIKDALVTYILANSSHDRDDWMTILPDIFKRTEFIIAPFWHKYAVEPLMLYPQGVRSPIIGIDELVEVTQAAAVDYLEPHIRDYVTATSFNYTSIGVGIIGNTENREGKYLVTDYYPDYFVCPTTGSDFNRMEQDTQDWVIEINNMLAYAETMTAVSSVPMGYTRVVRQDMVYIAKTINNVAFLVAVKSTLVPAVTQQDQN